MKHETLTFARLWERLVYDLVTGDFRWRINYGGKAKAGELAGYRRPDNKGGRAHGYVTIRIDYKVYRANRLAWFYMMGEWPAHEVDHENRVRSDNRWDNLREATDIQNRANSGVGCNNSHGFKGVCKRGRRWSARIRHAGKTKHIGTFAAPELAHVAYLTEAKRIHGEFAFVPEDAIPE